MHSHLAIIGKNGELALKPDTSVTITDKNPMFNDVEMFTQTIPLPFDRNRHVLKNMDDVNSTLRATDVENERFKFVLEGIPFRNASIKIQEGTKLDGTVDVNFDATNRTFKDMVQDMRCRDVTVDDNILIGEKIGGLDVSFSYYLEYAVYTQNAFGEVRKDILKDQHVTSVNATDLDPPATNFSFPGKCTSDSSPYYDATVISTADYGNGNIVNIPRVYESYINVSTPYGSTDESGKRWPYCNSRICYAHHDIDDEGKTTSDVVPSNNANSSVDADKSPYWVLPANRPASGICFYLGYFLERLFKTIGVDYDITALTNIEDFNYLAFFTTTCKYNTALSQYFQVSDIDEINKWLNDRGCGGRLEFKFEKLNYEDIDEADLDVLIQGGPNAGQIKKVHLEIGGLSYDPINDKDGLPIVSLERRPIFKQENVDVTARIYLMYANSENFPDADVSEVIESLENAFGVRFCYDSETNKVTVRLLRDMFRNQQAPIPFKGIVTQMVKETENIRGVKMMYSSESDSTEQRDNIRYGKRDYDTDYDYIEYPEKRTVLNKTYAQISQKIDSGDMNVYVIPETGNAIRIKVDEDASTVKELKPVLFEVGAFKGVEVGDCSKNAEDEDAIKNITIGFQPIVSNDVNFRNGGDRPGYQPILVPYIDEDMEHEFVECRLQNIINTEFGEVYFNYLLKHYEAYDPTGTDDGQSPLQHHDWGLAVGILRTGDGGAGVENYDPNYDGFGNWKWRDIADNYCMASDTMDQTGLWLGKTNPATAFSLKISAYKPFRYKYVDDVLRISTNPKEWDDTWLVPCNNDERNELGTITKRIRSRGLFDTFMAEYIRFLLQRQKYHIEAICTASELADIPHMWLRRWEINGKIGWFNLLKYPVSVEKGLGKVELEFFTI